MPRSTRLPDVMAPDLPSHGAGLPVAPAADLAALRRLVVTFMASAVMVVALLLAVPAGTAPVLAMATVAIPVAIGAAAGAGVWAAGRLAAHARA